MLSWLLSWLGSYYSSLCFGPLLLNRLRLSDRVLSRLVRLVPAARSPRGFTP